ncbi:hypothetical protein [Natronolimnobius baerhuensis]|uniref:Uncharacterized protein n=1 Tax=Natronolimnobius baerhuensis TaxID=253108 RepID=A0A202E6G0_9EURY|nr:hypothetical protein [Natronolimnobius baerhuensis]OVE83863.1 hypothetical protein B2G88_15735 [Natronolimnobius baerhuensis]
MTESPLEEIERQLNRATELETEDAMTLIRETQDRLESLEGDSSVDAKRRTELEERVQQRLRAVSERDAYDGGLGSAMNPTDDDAP